jgi:hypothetical protein
MTRLRNVRAAEPRLAAVRGPARLPQSGRDSGPLCQRPGSAHARLGGSATEPAELVEEGDRSLARGTCPAVGSGRVRSGHAIEHASRPGPAAILPARTGRGRLQGQARTRPGSRGPALQTARCPAYRSDTRGPHLMGAGSDGWRARASWKVAEYSRAADGPPMSNGDASGVAVRPREGARRDRTGRAGIGCSGGSSSRTARPAGTSGRALRARGFSRPTGPDRPGSRRFRTRHRPFTLPRT